jgi:hypothetical protein
MTPESINPDNGSDPAVRFEPPRERMVDEASRPTSASAILSFVFAFVFWPLGIVFAIAAFVRIAGTGERGGGLAVAGLLLSLLCLWITAQYVV